MPRTPIATTRTALSQRQNFQTNSEDITVGTYSVLNLTRATATAVGPDGVTLNANTITDNATSSVHFLDTGVIGVPGGDICTLSFSIKAGTLDNMFVGANNGAIGVFFKFSTLAFSGASATLLDFGYESFANNWYRVFITFNRVSGTSDRIYTALTGNNIVYAGASGTLLITQIQLNRGFYGGTAKYTKTSGGSLDDGTPRKLLY